ncbi:MAG: aminodeoxychorismate/anthranilate synthase component I [Hyphomonadaceae bacterium]|nr:aminodeoxychorismate/anthranilate synthase component I [Hyphomonadaceae bacterium]
MQPFVLSLPWREPIAALLALEQAIGDEAGTLAFIGGGTHSIARWSYVMHRPVRQRKWHEGDAGQPFDNLQATLDQTAIVPQAGLCPFQGGWAGLLSYELGRAFETLPWPNGHDLSSQRPDCHPSSNMWPDMWLGLYDTVAVFDAHHQRAFILSWGLDDALRPQASLAQTKAHALSDLLVDEPSQNIIATLRAAQVLKETRKHEEQALSHKVGHATGPNMDQTRFITGLHPSRDRGDAQAAIEKAVDYIHAGDIFQANISIKFEGQLAPTDNPQRLFERLLGRHPSPFATYLSLGDKAVVSHSPERFLSRTPDGQLETRPIKGTAPRHIDPDTDAANAASLLASIKDRAENLMIVDLMRNDLSRVCEPGSVKVPRLCALESFSTVHHLVSDVVGQQKRA